MTNPCHEYQEKISDMVLGMIEISDQMTVLEHIEHCAECKTYWDDLQAFDSRIEQWTGAGQMTDKIERVIGRLNELKLPQERSVNLKIFRRGWNWKRIAAVILVMAGIGYQVNYVVTHPVDHTTVGSNTSGLPIDRTGTVPQTTAEYNKRLNSEKQTAEKYFASGKAAALETLLKAGLPETKVLAAGYLGQIGNAGMIATLQKYSKQWPKDKGENPYQAAIEAIQKRLSEPNKP